CRRRKGIGGRLLRRPQQHQATATVDEFPTAVLNLGHPPHSSSVSDFSDWLLWLRGTAEFPAIWFSGPKPWESSRSPVLCIPRQRTNEGNPCHMVVRHPLDLEQVSRHVIERRDNHHVTRLHRTTPP